MALSLGVGLGLGGARPEHARAAPMPFADSGGRDDERAVDAAGDHPEPVAAAETLDEAKGPARRWVTHTVVPRETLDTIAMRYGVTRDQVLAWNEKKLGTKAWIYAGQALRIHARRFPPPREKIVYAVKKGDTWAKIAARFGVPADHLQDWNPKVPKAFKAGQAIKVYTDPKAPPPPKLARVGVVERTAAGLPELHVPPGGYEVGRPNQGHLVNGVQLPASEMVRILDPDKAWGTSHTIENLLAAIATFRRDSGYDRPLTISSISLEHGGRFGAHKSHRTGRDVDIRLPRKPGAPKGDAPSSIDWFHTWKLVEALASTGEVEYIFVSWSRQKYLYRAAQSAGATREQLERLVQWPRKPSANKGLVRHSEGHTVHLHVRFRCTPGNSQCESI